MDHLNQLPCPVLMTDASGLISSVNADLLALVGGALDAWLGRPMEDLFPPHSRIFLQTHVWPMLLRQGQVREIYLHLKDARGQRVPVMVNGRAGQVQGESGYYWIFFVALERSRFERELLNARSRADAAAMAFAKSERFIKTITDAMPGLVGYWDTDLHCRFANAAYQEWFGRHPDDVVGMKLKDLLGAEMYALNLPLAQRALAGEAQCFERTLTKADGSVSHTLAHYVPDRDDDSGVQGLFVLVSDVTELKRAEGELRLAASVVENTVEGIMVTDEMGTVLSVNPAFTEITGYRYDEVVGKTPRILKSNHHPSEFYAAMWQDLALNGRWEGETWNRRKAGDIFLVWQSITMIRSADDRPYRYVSIFNDITERWRQDERTRHLAFHDPLTDLPNRHLLMDRLGQVVGMTERARHNVALMFLDLDGFKQVNDTFGHDIGDELLIAVANKLLLQVRHSDTVARLGGDEFVILLDNPVNVAEVERVATRVVASLGEHLKFSGVAAQVSASVGVAVHPAHGLTAAQLLKSADTAMYAAKKAGKNTFRFFDPAMDALLVERNQ